MFIKIRQEFRLLYWAIAVNTFLVFTGCQTETKNIISTGSGDMPNGKVSKSSSKVYDGETIYRGVFQGRGEVADLIPEIRDHYKIDNYITNEKQLQSIKLLDDKIIEQINIIDANFFAEFQSGMQSGDHLIIQNTLSEAGKMSLKAFTQLPESKVFQDLVENPEVLEQALSEINAERDDSKKISSEEVLVLLEKLANHPEDPAAGLVAILVAVAWIAVAVDIAAVLNIELAIQAGLFVVWDTAVANSNAYYTSANSNNTDLMKERIINSIAILLRQ